MKTGIELITQEREEQLTKHNRTVENDVRINGNYELKRGAIALLTHNKEGFGLYWDTDVCNKMLDKSYLDRLIIAGALIAAEIDRIQYKKEEE